MYYQLWVPIKLDCQYKVIYCHRYTVHELDTYTGIEYSDNQKITEYNMSNKNSNRHELSNTIHTFILILLSEVIFTIKKVF